MESTTFLTARADALIKRSQTSREASERRINQHKQYFIPSGRERNLSLYDLYLSGMNPENYSKKRIHNESRNSIFEPEKVYTKLYDEFGNQVLIEGIPKYTIPPVDISRTQIGSYSLSIHSKNRFDRSIYINTTPPRISKALDENVQFDLNRLPMINKNEQIIKYLNNLDYFDPGSKLSDDHNYDRQKLNLIKQDKFNPCNRSYHNAIHNVFNSEQIIGNKSNFRSDFTRTINDDPGVLSDSEYEDTISNPSTYKEDNKIQESSSQNIINGSDKISFKSFSSESTYYSALGSRPFISDGIIENRKKGSFLKIRSKNDFFNSNNISIKIKKNRSGIKNYFNKMFKKVYS